MNVNNRSLMAYALLAWCIGACNWCSARNPKADSSSGTTVDVKETNTQQKAPIEISPGNSREKKVGESLACSKKKKISPRLSGKKAGVDIFGNPSFLNMNQFIVPWSNGGESGMVIGTLDSEYGKRIEGIDNYIDYYSITMAESKIAFVPPVGFGSKKRGKEIWMYEFESNSSKKIFETQSRWNGRICWDNSSGRFAFVEGKTIYVYDMIKEEVFSIVEDQRVDDCLGWGEDERTFLYIRQATLSKNDNMFEIVQFNEKSRETAVLLKIPKLTDYVWHAKKRSLFYREGLGKVFKLKVPTTNEIGESSTLLLMDNIGASFDISMDEKCIVYTEEFNDDTKPEERRYWTEVYMSCQVPCDEK
jgi:hypothetical protein